MIILDTNVVSEMMSPSPARAVMAWVATMPAAALYTTSVTEAEILFGAMRLPEGKRRRKVTALAEATFSEEFGGRVLPFDSAAAKSFAHIAVLRRQSGRPISGFDAQIAGIAHSLGATLCTRNAKEFGDCGIKLINPWRYQPAAENPDPPAEE